MSGPNMSDLMDGGETARAFRRFNVQFNALVAVDPGYEQPEGVVATRTVQALVTDVSMSGLHLATPYEFAIGSILKVDITIGTTTYPVPVTVRRVRPVGHAGRFAFTVGAQYVKSPYTAVFIPTLAKYLIVRGVLKAA